MPMPNRQVTDGNYRYAYQGQEKDPETGKEAFQLRLWDSRIGRWLTTDPAGQYHSPYMAMGNNPLRMVDPDGSTAIKFGGPPNGETSSFSFRNSFTDWFSDLYSSIGGSSDNDYDETKSSGGVIMNYLLWFSSEIYTTIDASISSLSNSLSNILPDGTEIYGTVDGSLPGQSKLEGGFTQSYFIDSFDNGVRGFTSGGGLGHSSKNVSGEVGFNLFYSTSPDGKMNLFDFNGFEDNYTLTFPFYKQGLSVNYINGPSYWGFGFGLTQKDIGFSVVRTSTTLHF